MKYTTILFEIIFVIVAIITCNVVFDYALFNRPITTWMILFGGSWVFVSILMVFCKPIKQSLFCIFLGSIIAITGAVIENNTDNPNYPHTGDINEERDQQTVGKCPNAEWIIILKYEEHGLMNEIEYHYVGSVEQVESALQRFIEDWNNKQEIDPTYGYPKRQIKSSSKNLVFVPRQWLKENKYPLDWSDRDKKLID